MQNQMNKYRRLKNLFFEAKLSGCLGRLSKKYFEKKFSEVGLYCPDSVQ